MKTVTVTSFRKNIFKLLDEVITTKQALIVQRKGKKIKIEVEKTASATEKLFSKPVRKNALIGDAQDFIHLKIWEWDEAG